MQDYTPLGSTATTTVKEGILNHEKNINALRSTYSGTAFPTGNLVAGLKCYRTDLGKTYTYNGETWDDSVATASLTVSGETSVPTPSTTNNSKTIANTEFVHGVVSDLVNGAPTALDTLQELADALGNDPNFSTTILNKIGEKESKTDAQIEHKRLQDAIPTRVSQLSNDSGYLTQHQSLDGYVKTVNNTAPDSNGNVTIALSGGGGVSTSESNTWTGKQTFQKIKFNFESYNAPHISGAIDNPSGSVAVYNVQGNFTLDMSGLAGLLSNGDATVFTAYITANGSYTLSITNAGTLKYAGSATDLAITANGLLLNIILIKSSDGVLSSVAQASTLS